MKNIKIHTISEISEKGKENLKKYLVNRELRNNNLTENYSRMLKEGHIELVDYDIGSPLKVQKAVGVTQEGKDFLNGE